MTRTAGTFLATLTLALACAAVPARGADAAAAAAAAPAAERPAPSGSDWAIYDTPYHRIHTDLDPSVAREAALRMTKVAEEYRRQLRAFPGAVEERLPVYLFARAEDYHATGAPRASAGAFTGKALLAIATGADGGLTWHVLQHEAFHQFSAAIVRRELPAWLEEGLGEYFGEALFVGDGYVTGAIPPWRVKRVKRSIRDGKWRSLAELLEMTREQWNATIGLADYDAAWSLVHFLKHGTGGERADAFDSFLKSLAAGRSTDEAWADAFGAAGEFERGWREYWRKLPEEPTRDAYLEATARTLASFLARATAAGQRFSSFASFAAEAKAGRLSAGAADWLPPALLQRALAASAKQGGEWAIETGAAGKPPQLVVRRDGLRIACSFVLRGGRVASVAAERSRPEPGPEGVARD